MASVLHGDDGLVLRAAGDISADRNGLWAGSCLFSFPAGKIDLVPAINSLHPHVGFLIAERFRVVFEPGLWKVYVDYVGCNVDASEPQYELTPGTGNEPIQIHDRFESVLAGKPSAPLNGAIFRDSISGEVTHDDDLGEFDRFAADSPYAGLESFIAQNNTVWSKSWTQRSKPASTPVRISNPSGPAPDYGGSYNWLEFPVAYTKRGNVYSCTQRWMSSGPKGWNTVVYD